MSSTFQYGEWIQYDLGTSKALGRYEYITGSSNSWTQATYWTILGSNDEITWTRLHKVTNAPVIGVTEFVYTAPISGSYRYIRFVFNRFYGIYNWINTGLLVSIGFAVYDPNDAFLTEITVPNGTWLINALISTSSMFNYQYVGPIFRPNNIYFPNIYITLNNWRYNRDDNTYLGSTTTEVAPVFGPPDAPDSISGSHGNRQATITFTPGAENNAAIINYKYSLDDGLTYIICDPAVTSSPIIISDLTNGTEYRIRIRGVNTYGDGTPSSYVSVTPSTIPDAPTNLIASYGGSGNATISFTPGNNGGATILNYAYSIDGINYIELTPTDSISPVTITGLTNDTEYLIRLKALNTDGPGISSSSVIYTAIGPPDAPTNMTWIDIHNNAISVSFTEGNNQGSAIVNYKYSLDNGSSYTLCDPFDISSPIIISGLTNGQSYDIKLLAVNAAGDGVPSDTITATTYGYPDAPTSISWNDNYNGSMLVSFTPGSDNGGIEITNYSYSLDNGAHFTELYPAQATSPITINGLYNRTNYTLLLKAINNIGTGPASAPLSFRYMCFLEGTKILCYDPESKQEIERPIESLRKGDLVKTCLNGYKPVDTIGTSKIYNPANSMRSLNRLYRCPKENYPSLTEDLVITGCHSILVKDITDEERATLIDIQEKIYVTEKHYRLIAAADKKAVPYEQEGVFNIWHIALEHPQYTFNYGVYANGLLVESSSMRMMREMSGMNLIQ